MTWTACLFGFHELVEPSSTQDRICDENECTCLNGTGSTGSACETHGMEKCATCGSGYGLYANGSSLLCEACTVDDYEFSLNEDNSACEDHVVCGVGEGSNFQSLDDSSLEASTCVECEEGQYSDSEGYGSCMSWSECGVFAGETSSSRLSGASPSML